MILDNAIIIIKIIINGATYDTRQDKAEKVEKREEKKKKNIVLIGCSFFMDSHCSVLTQRAFVWVTLEGDAFGTVGFLGLCERAGCRLSQALSFVYSRS